MTGSIEKKIQDALRQIPPLWPLASQVAVNPYIGQSSQALADAAARLERVGGGPVTMPRTWYLDRIESGAISDKDLVEAISASPYSKRPETIEEFKLALKRKRPPSRQLPTVAQLATEASGINWTDFVSERIGAWAGTHFDAGQALWTSTQGKSAWSAYRIFASHDITPEIIGLRDFASFIADSPDSSLETVRRCVERLELDEDALDSYFHQLFLSLEGYAQFARHLLWRAELSARSDTTAVDLLAIRLIWETALFKQYEDDVHLQWSGAKASHAEPLAPSYDDIVDEIAQEASERAMQRGLCLTLAGTNPSPIAGRPMLQAAFCIDVRSEIFRRSLESLDPAIRTAGFAGFFGMALRHQRFASDIEEARLPVLLNPTVHSCATSEREASVDRISRFHARARRAWGRFKMAAVSSFAFVEAMGPIYGFKLLRDAFAMRAAPLFDQSKPHLVPPLGAEIKTMMAESALRGMSMTQDFARIVLLVGHGANVVNNPHASALHCGACGGYPGDVNARILAGILNDRDTRATLAEKGIDIPADTIFMAALHDTTTDKVVVFAEDGDISGHQEDLSRMRAWLASAGRLARAERALRLPRARTGADIPHRARDWAEIRPEWGLAGCNAFIAAPRSRTTARDLGGRAFLHDYDWRQDRERGFPVLELIITAPVVVASWISLQYYGSTVAPRVFGAGNKLLHNAVGGIGVLEGNGGLIRGGLPWQSVHDGDRFVHEPLRLTVLLEAPRDAIISILERHPEVRALFDARWLHLLAIDGADRPSWRYAGGLRWEALN